MTEFRHHVARLREADDLVRVVERVHWADTAPAVGAEAARSNGPAVVLEDTVGYARLVSGAYGGRDGTAPRDAPAWSRLALGLGLDPTVPYGDLLATLGGTDPAEAVSRTTFDAREVTGTDIRSLGLPAVGTTDIPAVTLAMAAVGGGVDPVHGTAGESVDESGGDSVDETDGDASASTAPAYRWAPVRGSVHGSDRLRVVLPAPAAGGLDEGDDVSIALGVPAAALATAITAWTRQSSTRADPALQAAGVDDGLAVAEAATGPLPASSEVVVECEVVRAGVDPSGVTEAWELAVDTQSLELRVRSIATRDSPLVPFSPTKAPMADDTVLAGTLEAARLYERVNTYWGVAPVAWVALPAETGLGVCLVASEVLYAGFEWQLANALFSFSRLFDKVVVLDADTPAVDLSRAFDDLWVKADPATDWEFSEPDAPAASAPLYRRDGATGSNLYVDAAWDPRWEEAYIAPRVTFETSYPEALQRSVRERWLQLGFERSGTR